MWQSDGTDQDWGLRVGWHILASTLTVPGKWLTQKPLNCPHIPGTSASFNQRFLFLKCFHLPEVRHISAFLTGACVPDAADMGASWRLVAGGGCCPTVGCGYVHVQSPSVPGSSPGGPSGGTSCFFHCSGSSPASFPLSLFSFFISHYCLY